MRASTAVHITLVCSVAVLHYVEADRPRVETSLGQVEGVWQTSGKGLKYAAFMGIPYAKPPINELRFEVKILDFFYLKFEGRMPLL